MKKLLILFLAFGLLTSCNNNKTKSDKTTDTEKTDKDSKDNKDNTDKTTTDTEKTDNTTAGWPQKDRDDFLGSCVDKAYESSGDRALSENYCECMLGKLEGKYPDVERAKQLTQTEINDLLTEYAPGCRGDK